MPTRPPAQESRPEALARRGVGDVTTGSHVYKVKISGVASDLVRAEFEDVDLWVVPGTTCLRTGLVDQAALFGLIRRIEDLGLVLLEVEAIDHEG